MVVHRLELLSKLNGLVEVGSLSGLLTLDLDSSLLEDILELGHLPSILVEFHVVLGLGKSSDQLTACLAATSKHLNCIDKNNKA